jgi:hypothetical protein
MMRIIFRLNFHFERFGNATRPNYTTDSTTRLLLELSFSMFRTRCFGSQLELCPRIHPCKNMLLFYCMNLYTYSRFSFLDFRT